MDPQMDARMELSLQMAREAAEIALPLFEQAKNRELKIMTKGVQDWLSQADTSVESHIRGRIEKAFPEDGFLGEESGASEPGRGTWVVDPIDGTGNFVRGIDLWCISIAYYCDGAVRIGVIYDPVRDCLYHAQAGRGAFCNQEPIRVSDQGDPQRSLVIMGYSSKTSRQDHLDAIEFLIKSRIDYRRFGSATVALVQVASGQAEAYFEHNINSWGRFGRDDFDPGGRGRLPA